MKKNAPEFLLVDIGNTRLKWATGGRHWPNRIAGEIDSKQVSTAWIKALSKKYPHHPTVVASVVPKLTVKFRRGFSKRLIEISASLLELGRFDDFRFDYPKPNEIGADRIAAAVAVHAWGRFPAVIVACGTATAFTVLDARGCLCGGAIAPGLQAQLTSLLGATAQLPVTNLRTPRSALAKSTQDAINAGVMFSFQGGVKEIIHQLTKALPGNKKPKIILTGGNAHYLADKLSMPVTLRPLLVFEGLLIIGSRLLMPAT